MYRKYPGLKRYLIGAWDMIDAGMKPSDAVSVGVDLNTQVGLAEYLGVRSLKSLDRMGEDELRRLLGSTAV